SWIHRPDNGSLPADTSESGLHLPLHTVASLQIHLSGTQRGPAGSFRAPENFK
ncbi:hypothetical protein BgiMline_032350, partial [Biomphalaria glabrata]